MEYCVHIVPSIMPKMEFIQVSLQVFFTTMMMYSWVYDNFLHV